MNLARATKDYDERVAELMKDIARAMKGYDERMAESIERHIAMLRAELQVWGMGEDAMGMVLAAFRQDIEADAARSRKELRRECFTVIGGGKK